MSMHPLTQRMINNLIEVLDDPDREGYLTQTKSEGEWMRIEEALTSIVNRIQDECNAARIVARGTEDEDNPSVTIELTRAAMAVIELTRIMETETQITVSDRVRELKGARTWK